MTGSKNKSLYAAALLIAFAAVSLTACGDPDGGAGNNGAGGTANGYGNANGNGEGYLPPKVGVGDTIDNAIAKEWGTGVSDRVFFDTDKSTLKPEGEEDLQKWVAFLKKYPGDKLMIQGHSDERGTEEYNLALGERRAEAVKEFLIANGIDPTRLRTVTYGKERPAVLGSNESAWAQNRRAVGVLE